VAASLGALVPVVKFEGDAVFAAGGEPPADDTSLLTAIVDTYVGFRQRQRAISVATSCDCDACRKIPDLELPLHPPITRRPAGLRTSSHSAWNVCPEALVRPPDAPRVESLRARRASQPVDRPAER
jgi:hypothetical protein